MELNSWNREHKEFIEKAVREMNGEEVGVADWLTKLTEWISKIEYLVEKVDSIYQLLYKEPEELDTEIDSLDGFVYKAKVIDKLNISMIRIGTVDELGVIELYEIETYAPIVPSLYQPEFYYIGKEESEPLKSKYRGANIPKPIYKKFTPKTYMNQVLLTKGEDTFTTGYINENGVAIYYDQLPKDANEEKLHSLKKPDPQEIVVMEEVNNE